MTPFIAGYLYKEALDASGHHVTPKANMVKPKDTGPGIAGVYGAVEKAETGSESDPFIRTKHRPVEGSSAYGPVQIGSKLDDYTPAANPKFYANMSKDQQLYLNKLHHQRKLFLQYGNEPNKEGYKDIYEYGGKGIAGNSPRDRMLYHQVVSKIMRAEIAKRGGDQKLIPQIWKGNNMRSDHSSGWNKRFKSHFKRLGY